MVSSPLDIQHGGFNAFLLVLPKEGLPNVRFSAHSVWYVYFETALNRAWGDGLVLNHYLTCTYAHV